MTDMTAPSQDTIGHQALKGFSNVPFQSSVKECLLAAKHVKILQDYDEVSGETRWEFHVLKA
jgi:hypothetical protein